VQVKENNKRYSVEDFYTTPAFDFVKFTLKVKLWKEQFGIDSQCVFFKYQYLTYIFTAVF
jgi:hypothetical protein